MKRLTVQLMLLFYLLSGSAWAADTCRESWFGHDTPVVQTVDDTGSPGYSLSPQCDHCCHASAHYLGLPAASLIVGPLDRPVFVAPQAARWFSFGAQPPTEPPRI
ncbi:MAG TPA: hypothetical protein ENK54_06645 [Thiotrichales bacterium]|nr:hypothetical protein [Thiotrichales bacterium]